MKISGFTLVRNGTKFDYPYEESLRSLIPLVDEMVVNVGIGDDDTLERVRIVASEFSNKSFVIFESHWPLDDPEKKKGGLILSEQTNLALDRCTGEWCFYLQADEVLHEQDYRILQNTMREHANNASIEGLLFDYVHLYGSYDVVQQSRSAYRREVRAFKRASGSRSVGDAQSFRKADHSKLRVVHTGARIFHYGWVRTPEAMKAKTYFMDQLYHGKPADNDKTHTGENYRYKRFWGLNPYIGSHPTVMHMRIRAKGWHWDLKRSPLAWKLGDVKKVLSDSFEALTDIRPFEYRSYELIKSPKTHLEPVQTETTPTASLIIATYDMPRHLELVLAALERQSTKDYEIFICDDGSGPETARAVSDFRKRAPVMCEHLWQEHKGFRKSLILNQAIKKARGEALIFLDGDCIPHKDFIKDHIQNQERGHYLAGRRVELGPELSAQLTPKIVRDGFFDRPSLKLAWSCIRSDSTHFQRTLRVRSHWLRRGLRMDRVVDLKGCNYSVSREDMLAIGGYDESFEGYGREDTDVEIRLKHLGLKIKSIKGMALQFHVWHPRREFTPANEMRLEQTVNTRRIRAEHGIEG